MSNLSIQGHIVFSATSTQTWLASVHWNNLCSNYTQYKTTLTKEPYLTLLEKKHAINVCKFRTRNHRLPIMVGRHLGIDRAALQLCTLCSNKSIGDEHHFLFEFSVFQKEQMQFLEPRHMQYPIDRWLAGVFDTENAKQLTYNQTITVYWKDHGSILFNLSTPNPPAN